MNTITLDAPLDMHLHLREGDMLKAVAPFSARHFAGAVVMPNLVPPLDSLERLESYKKEIHNSHDQAFSPYMTVFFKPYSRETLLALRPHIIGIKLYPKGATTNSDQGLADLAEASATLKCMEELEIPLLVHGEDPSAFVMDRETVFLENFRHLHRQFPRLQIVMEHITTAAALDLLGEIEGLFATVTLHHLMISLDDVAGGELQPHLFCKPIAKRPEDRDALLQAALKAHPKLSFGSDSAPHPRHRKEACGCAAGVFSAPIALPALCQLFEKHDALDQLQSFVSGNAQRIYNIKPISKQVRLIKKDWTVPQCYGDVVPYLHGENLNWAVDEIF